MRPLLKDQEFKGQLLFLGNRGIITECFGSQRFVAIRGGYLKPTPTDPNIVLELLESGNYFPILEEPQKVIIYKKSKKCTPKKIKTSQK